MNQPADQPDDAVHAPAKKTARKTLKKKTVSCVFCGKEKSYRLKSLIKAEYDSDFQLNFCIDHLNERGLRLLKTFVVPNLLLQLIL